ncbi:MAG: lycopene cyclase domain-containing protein [Chloroflexota bacterium]|nr:lycopene cyclase domain-containing protein [Chloroflexota bacterium]
MTYFGVLARFIGVPLVMLMATAVYDRRREREFPHQFRTTHPWGAVLTHVAIALIYTTPWDNYLVANRVWWYDPNLVTGITLGWVPIEEYTFFVVQTLMTGMWLLLLMRRWSPVADPPSLRSGLRWAAAGSGGALWLVWVVVLLAGWTEGLYMALILVWALPPIILQLAFGADILWRYRRLVLTGLLPPFLYLCFVDALAINSGTWTISPEKTFGLDLGGILPLEEAIFFLVTNVLIVFGVVLMLAKESRRRLRPER